MSMGHFFCGAQCSNLWYNMQVDDKFSHLRVYPINYIGKGLYYIVKECTINYIQYGFAILPRNK